MRALAVIAVALALAACDGQSRQDRAADLAKSDPAVTEALENPIMTDRGLAASDDSRRLRSVSGPARAIQPLRSPENRAIWEALAPLLPKHPCEEGLAAGPQFARSLPAEFAPPPGARLIEAGGKIDGQCRVRIAAYRVDAPPAALAEAYRARLGGAGYAVRPQLRDGAQVLSGERASDSSSYYLVAAPDGQGSTLSLLVSNR